MYQFSLEYLKRAIKALHGSNAEDYFKIYLILKRFGLRYRPNTQVVVDTKNTEHVVNELFFVRELGEINGNSPIYDPMRNVTLKHDASRSIIQTNIKKISLGGLAMGKVDWLTIVQRDDKKWVVGFSPLYPSGLGADASGFAIRNTQITIPTPEFLAWLYRYETFEEIPTFADLFSHMAAKMNFTEEEILILFDEKREWDADTFAQAPLDEKALARFILEEAGLGAEALRQTPRSPFSRNKFRRIIGAFQTMEAENIWWLPTDVVDEAREILQRQKTLLLVGAPATGKTRLAKQLAQELVEGEDQIHVFQFHASYTYEDFIEGLVPYT